MPSRFSSTVGEVRAASGEKLTMSAKMIVAASKRSAIIVSPSFSRSTIGRRQDGVQQPVRPLLLRLDLREVAPLALAPAAALEAGLRCGRAAAPCRPASAGSPRRPRRCSAAPPPPPSGPRSSAPARRAAAASDLIRRSSSMPFMPGIRMSTISRSNSCSRRISSACRARARLGARCARPGAAGGASRSRLVLTSSTTRIRPGSPVRRSGRALDRPRQLRRDRQVGRVGRGLRRVAAGMLDQRVDPLEQQPGLAPARCRCRGRRVAGSSAPRTPRRPFGIAEDGVDRRAQVVAQLRLGLRRPRRGAASLAQQRRDQRVQRRARRPAPSRGPRAPRPDRSRAPVSTISSWKPSSACAGPASRCARLAA